MVDGLTRSVPKAVLAALVWLSCPVETRAVTIELGTATAVRGGKALVTGVLRAGGKSAVGLEVVMTPDRGIAPTGKPNGRPLCVSYCPDYEPVRTFATALAASLDDEDPTGSVGKKECGSSAAFTPPGCYPGLNCEGVHYLELALYSVDPILDGGAVFTCSFDVADDAAFGAHAVVCSNPGSSDDSGMPLETRCTDGAVHVGCPGDCDGDGHVAVHELVTGFAIAQREIDSAECSALDLDSDGAVTIAEIVRAFHSLLEGCD